MVLTNKKLSVLAVLAAALLVTTVIVHSGGFFEPKRDFTPGSMLIQGLDPQKIAKVTVKSGDETLTFQSTDRGFVLAERQSHPALFGKLSDLVMNCMDIRCASLVTENKDNHKELGVAADDKDATVVTLLDKDGKVITGVVIGKPASTRGGGVNARLVDKDAVYVTEKWVSFPTQASDYLDTELLKVAKEDVLSVTVQQKDAVYTAVRDAEGAVSLKNVPKGKRAKQNDVESLFDALSDLKFDDIASGTTVATKTDTTFICKTSQQVTYIVKLAKKDNKHYVVLACGGPDEDFLKSIAGADKDDQPGIREMRQAAQNAKKYAEQFTKDKSWVYEIASWDAGKMRKTLADLIEDAPAPATKPAPTTKP